MIDTHMQLMIQNPEDRIQKYLLSNKQKCPCQNTKFITMWPIYYQSNTWSVGYAQYLPS